MLPQIRSQFDQQIGQDLESGRSQENIGLIDSANKTINIKNIAGVIEQHEIERLKGSFLDQPRESLICL